MAGEGQTEQKHADPPEILAKLAITSAPGDLQNRRFASGSMVCPHCGVAFPQAWPGAGRGFMAHVFEYLATGTCYFSADSSQQTVASNR